MNYLLCSVGRRGELLKQFKQSLPEGECLVATDCSQYAPALYYADKQYIVPPILSADYIDTLIDICIKEDIAAVMTFIDPEIELLATNRSRFERIGVEVLVPHEETAHLCFDKYQLFLHLRKCGIPTIATWDTLESFAAAMQEGKVAFPVFVKPRTGSGSVGAQKVETMEHLVSAINEDSSLIIQEYMTGLDIDADVYVDIISNEAVSAFLKRKIETRIGGASKTVSFKDQALFATIQKIVSSLQLRGAVDMDFFYQDGIYYLSEINPRFGGAYIHAYMAGVNFVEQIVNNLNGIANEPEFGNYEEGVVMMMYDSIVIRKESELA